MNIIQGLDFTYAQVNAVIPVTFEPASEADRSEIISVINQVAAERIYLQTDRYCPTPAWERLLDKSIDLDQRLGLFVVKYKHNIIGFGRIIPQAETLYGNVGIVLLNPFRSLGIGTALLNFLIHWAGRLGYDRMTADILTTNIRSIRLFRRFHFRERDIHLIQSPFSTEKIQEITFELEL